jgi:hypothetical protein
LNIYFKTKVVDGILGWNFLCCMILYTLIKSKKI